ncbi:MAG: hypothetical protein AAF573_10175 [Bacteroidota bacterium]
MSTAEIKNVLHKLVVETERHDILEKVKVYFDLLNSRTTNWWDDLGEQQRNHIHQAIREIESGNFSAREEVRTKINAGSALKIAQQRFKKEEENKKQEARSRPRAA